jgi:hypothetical protein
MANLFLEAKELLLQNDGLNYINYDQLSQERKEFLRSDLWDFTWTVPCNAVYFPGDAFVKARTQAVNPSFNSAIGQLSAIIRNFQIYQNTYSGTTAGTISITYQDFEDQAIMAWLDDWREKLGDREHRYTFRKEDTCAEGRLTVYNSSRKPIRIYDVYTIQLQDPGAPGLYSPSYNSDDPANMGEITANFSFEHMKLIWKNV